MRTRNSYFSNNSSVTIPRHRNKRRTPNVVEPKLRTIIEVAPMADNSTMEKLVQAPTKGYEEAIVILEINADHFEIKTNLLQLVQANPYHSFERENPHTHINNFKMITSTMKFRDVPNDVIKLMMFPYSLEGSARIWDNASKMDDRIDKLADQILTLVDIFAKKVVTPAPVKAVEESCVTCGGNHAYYNCPNTDSNQPSVCVATGTYNQVAPQNRASNFMARPGFAPNQSSTSGTLPSNTIPNPKGEMKAITTRSGVAYEGPSIPTPKKVMERETEETTDKEQTNFQRSTAHIQPSVTLIPEPVVLQTLPKPNIPYPSRLNDQKLCEKASNQMKKFFQIFQHFHFDISFADALLLMPKFASTIKSLLTNKDKLFELAKIPLNENCSAMLLKILLEKLEVPGKFLIPCDFPGMNVCHALADLGASINLMPLSIWKKLSLPKLTPTWMTLELADRSITCPKGVTEDVFVKVGKFHFPTDFVVVDFEADPRVPLILGRSFLSTGRALIDVYGEEITLRVNDEAEILGFSNNSLGGNPTLTSEPILSDSSLSLAPFEGSDFILEEIDAYLKDESISPEIDHADCDLEGDICLIEKLFNDDPFQLPPMDLKQGEVAKAKSLIEEPPDLELKDLPSHLEYAYLEGVDKLPVIIAKDLKVDEKEALLKVLKSHKRAIAWKITDIKGIDPRFCTHKILMEDDYKPAVQSQRWVNPRIHEVIKKEVIKLLDAEIIYSISDSPWVIPIHCVPKKGRITVVENEKMILFLHGVRCFLGHAGFYRRFIQEFSKIARPMTHLLEKETPFVFSKDCIDAFKTLKKKLTEAPILVVPDWNLTFKLMCDATDFSIGTVLGQQKTKHFQPVHYASKTMTETQIHYTTMEKEMLAVVYAFEKFRPYLVLSKSIVYTDHSALKYLLSKQDAKPRLIRWVVLLQEFDIIICDKKGTKNLAADHLSRLENLHKDVFENKDLNENFPLETLVMSKYGVTHRLAFAYHPQTSGQVEVSNRGLKRILERMVEENRVSWSEKLDDALWTFRTAYKTPIGCTPYKLVYRKSCHLPIDLEHKAYWALKHVNVDLKTVGDYRKLQLNELRDQAYENFLIYKEKTKKLHDSKIKNRIFNVGDRDLLFNSRLKIFSGKLKTRWSGPFTITKFFPYGTVELSQPDGPNFKVNGHYVKHYFGEDIPQLVVPDL
nr:reverse transcriptase domain-containing protein [Tanacetum cinerariifolium]